MAALINATTTTNIMQKLTASADPKPRRVVTTSIPLVETGPSDQGGMTDSRPVTAGVGNA
jgi:hypothetical protein